MIKRYVGPAHFAVNSVLAAAALRRLARPGPAGRWSAAAALVAHGSATAILARVFQTRVTRHARMSATLPGYQAAGLAGTLALAAQGRDSRTAAARAAVLAVGGNALYAHWYSRLDREPAPGLVVGARMPDATFTDQDGRAVTTASLRGAPTVYMFLRGNWCPVCMAQAREIAARYRELEAMGVRVVLVAAQDEDHTRALADDLGVAFTYLGDPGLRASRALGLVHEGGRPPGIPGYDADSIFPTVVVCDADGAIVFCHQTDNYRVRPTPELIFSVLPSRDPEPSEVHDYPASVSLSGT